MPQPVPLSSNGMLLAVVGAVATGLVGLMFSLAGDRYTATDAQRDWDRNERVLAALETRLKIHKNNGDHANFEKRLSKIEGQLEILLQNQLRAPF